MKKTLVLLVALFTFFSFASAEESHVESVVQMPFTVELPDVVREGLYTGEIENEVPNGYGLFTTTNSSGTSWHYIGQWKNGMMSGQGGQYWDIGQCIVGLYESNDFICGETHTTTYENYWVDYRPNEHGCYNYKQYRPEGSLMFDGCVNAETGRYHQGTFYSADGKVIHTGNAEGMEPSLDYSLDLTNVTYDQLVSIKDQLNLAMWNSQEWQEVEVPQGVWKIGEDIPAGHWTITASPTAWVGVTYGSELDDNQKEINWLCKGYYHELLKGEKHIFATKDDLHSIDINTQNGYYIEIEDGSVVFTPYSGKPSLGFK